MTQLSRRGFLTGAVAAVATVAALPVLTAPAAAKLVVDPATFAHGGIVNVGPYPGPFLYLYPSQWDRFERSGFNMDCCRRVEMIPTSKPKKVRRGKRR